MDASLTVLWFNREPVATYSPGDLVPGTVTATQKELAVRRLSSQMRSVRSNLPSFLSPQNIAASLLGDSLINPPET